MRIKYSPLKYNEYADTEAQPDTIISIINDNAIKVDDELYEFDFASIKFPDICALTEGVILEAYRDDSDELYITVRRSYTGDCTAWDTGEYHEINR